MSAEPAPKRQKMADSSARGVGGLAALGLGGGGGGAGSLVGSILGHIGPKEARPDVRPLPVVLLVGAAGCGKGTQAQMLVDHLKFRHISCGELYRKIQSAEGSQLHKQLQESRGKQEYDQRVKALHLILRKEFKMSVDDKSVAGLVIDGCRRSDQASNINRALRAEGLQLTLSLLLAVDTEVAAARLFCRLVHPSSGRMYNTKTNPPKVPMTDDVTGEPLEIRDNDTDLHTFRIRMETWEQNSEPVFNFLRGVSSMPDPIDSNNIPDDVFTEVTAALFGGLKDFPLEKLTYSPANQTLPSPNGPTPLDFRTAAESSPSSSDSPAAEEDGEVTVIAVLADGVSARRVQACRDLMARHLNIPEAAAGQLRFSPLRANRLKDESTGVLAAAHNRLARLVVDFSDEVDSNASAAGLCSLPMLGSSSAAPLAEDALVDSRSEEEVAEDEEYANRDAVQCLLISPKDHPLPADEMKEESSEHPRSLKEVLPWLNRRAGLVWDPALLSAESQLSFRRAIIREEKDSAPAVLRVPATEGRPGLRILLVTLPPPEGATVYPVTDVKHRPVVRIEFRKGPVFRVMTKDDIDGIFKKNNKRAAAATAEEDSTPGKWETVKNNNNGQKVFIHTGTKKVLPITLPTKWAQAGWIVAVNSSREKLYWYNTGTKQSVWITPSFPMSPPDVDQDLSYGIRRPVQWRSPCDLHLHSTCSDGTLTPEQVMMRAHENGVRTLALTDHDTTSGVQEALQLGQRMGIRVIPGIEVSSEHKDGSVHVLGYWADAERVLNDKPFQDFLKSMVDQRLERAKLMLSKLAGEGIHIELAKVQELADGVIGRPHVAEALKNAGHVVEIEDAFRKYLRYGRPAYVESTQTLPPEAAVAMIKKLGGLAVFAHPWCYRGNVHKVLQTMIEAGLDGMEVFKYPDNVKKFSSLCTRHNLVMTGGSDFHNRIKEAGIIERQPGELPLPEEHVKRFLERLDEVEKEYLLKQENARRLQSTKARLNAFKALQDSQASSSSSSSGSVPSSSAAAPEGSAAEH